MRRNRERLPGPLVPAEGEGEDRQDWVALIPAESAGPAERVERREAIARSREALKTLKPQELRALTLLAEGYSYAEIGEITGYSRDQNQPLPRRGARALPQGALAQRGRPALRGDASAALGLLRRGGGRRGDGDPARAPARLRPLPGDAARLPRGPRGGGRARPGAAALAFVAGARPRRPGKHRLAAARPGRGGGLDDLPGGRYRRGARSGDGGAGEGASRSAPGRRAGRPPAWRRGWCRRRSTSAPNRRRGRRSSEAPHRAPPRRARASNTNRRRPPNQHRNRRRSRASDTTNQSPRRRRSRRHPRGERSNTRRRLRRRRLRLPHRAKAARRAAAPPGSSGRDRIEARHLRPRRACLTGDLPLERCRRPPLLPPR